MSRKFTEYELKEFKKEYDSLIYKTYSDIVSTGRIQFNVMKEHEGQCLIDMAEFARESFWYHLRKYSEENYQMEAAVQEVNKLIKSDD